MAHLLGAAQERVALAAKLKEDKRDGSAMANVARSSRSGPLVEHDLFGKPVSTFPDHALDLWWGMIFSENRYPLFRIML
jgi:hypothetical protein